MAVSIGDMADGAGTLRLGSKVYHLRKVKGHDWADLEAWVRRQLGDPFASVRSYTQTCRPAASPPVEPKLPPGKKLGDLSQEEVKAHLDATSLWQKTYDDWTADWRDYETDRKALLLQAKAEHDMAGSPLSTMRGQAIVKSFQGTVMLFYLAARWARPGLTIEEVEADLRQADITAIQKELDAVHELPDDLADAIEKKDPELPTADPSSPSTGRVSPLTLPAAPTGRPRCGST